MCGIFGIVSDGFRDVAFREYTDRLSHRGPDASGYYQDQFISLGHRRLSIIDVEGSKQPLENAALGLVIIFNGEIYNYRELRDELRRKGYNFSSNGDTEVILKAYEEWGDKCVNYLRGMFAFAIWNSRTKELLLARDRLGIKPLFYSHQNGRLYFSSEIKSIVADPAFSKDIDEHALVSFFSFSYISGSKTIYKDIFKLEPGHCIKWRSGNVMKYKYWDLYFYPNRNKSEDQFVEEFLYIFSESIREHLISDVPLGAFLSGGVDSSAVVSFMSTVSDSPVNTFTIGFGGNVGNYLDEREYANQVATLYKTKHSTYEVLPRLDGMVDKIVDAFDEPFADDSAIPTYYVCEAARKSVTVALSGLGGDELFAGYERYLGFKLQGIYGKLPLFFRKKLLTNIVNMIPERKDGHYTINHMKRFVRGGALEPDQCYINYNILLDEQLRDKLFVDGKRYLECFHHNMTDLSNLFKAENVDGEIDSLDRALFVDMKTYLPEDVLALTDRISMQHSLEVRVPFLDHRLVEFAATIPPELRMKGFEKKYLLKKAIADKLPREILSHRKQGFVGPTANWIRTDLREEILDILSDRNLSKHGILRKDTVSAILNDHFRGKELNDKLIWSLVIFQRWFERNM